MASNDHLADLIVGHYERHAREWDADRRTLPWVDRPWIDLFAGLLPAGGAVLDLGCGGGDPVATSLARHGLKVTGVDASRTLISLCRERMTDQRWIVGDMRKLAFNECFDGVLAWDSFFHLKPDDQIAMFPVFAAHAAPGAVLMFNAGPARDEAIGAYRGDALYHASLDAAEYERLLDGAGFDLLEHVVGDVDKGGRVVWIARRR
jgi:2-polyprenyl-3-methyl-5-hydroxy-6-metoxy-1,4-benzoquinol methylase